MLCNVNAQCDVNIAMHGNGNKNVITEKKKKKKKKKKRKKKKITTWPIRALVSKIAEKSLTQSSISGNRIVSLYMQFQKQ